MMVVRMLSFMPPHLNELGTRGLMQGQKVTFDTQEDCRTGEIAVANIQAA
jgi:cold shock protein